MAGTAQNADVRPLRQGGMALEIVHVRSGQCESNAVPACEHFRDREEVEGDFRRFRGRGLQIGGETAVIGQAEPIIRGLFDGAVREPQRSFGHISHGSVRVDLLEIGDEISVRPCSAEPDAHKRMARDFNVVLQGRAHIGLAPRSSLEQIAVADLSTVTIRPPGVPSRGRIDIKVDRFGFGRCIRAAQTARAGGWRRLTLPFAWTALRLRAELESLRGRVSGA